MSDQKIEEQKNKLLSDQQEKEKKLTSHNAKVESRLNEFDRILLDKKGLANLGFNRSGQLAAWFFEDLFGAQEQNKSRKELAGELFDVFKATNFQDEKSLHHFLKLLQYYCVYVRKFLSAEDLKEEFAESSIISADFEELLKNEDSIFVSQQLVNLNSAINHSSREWHRNNYAAAFSLFYFGTESNKIITFTIQFLTSILENRLSVDLHEKLFQLDQDSLNCAFENLINIIFQIKNIQLKAEAIDFLTSVLIKKGSVFADDWFQKILADENSLISTKEIFYAAYQHYQVHLALDKAVTKFLTGVDDNNFSEHLEKLFIFASLSSPTNWKTKLPAMIKEKQTDHPLFLTEERLKTINEKLLTFVKPVKVDCVQKITWEKAIHRIQENKTTQCISLKTQLIEYQNKKQQIIQKQKFLSWVVIKFWQNFGVGLLGAIICKLSAHVKEINSLDKNIKFFNQKITALNYEHKNLGKSCPPDAHEQQQSYSFSRFSFGVF